MAAGRDYGRSLRVAAEVSAAARAGAAFASTSAANSLNTAGIQAAAINSVPDVSGMTVSSVRSCKCPGGGAVLCSGRCAGNMLGYVQVNARAASTNIFSYPGLGFSGWTAARVSASQCQLHISPLTPYW